MSTFHAVLRGMDELGFRPCRECGKRALIELAHGNGRICARCYVKRTRLGVLAHHIANRALVTSGASRPPPTASEKHRH